MAFASSLTVVSKQQKLVFKFYVREIQDKRYCRKLFPLNEKILKA